MKGNLVETNASSPFSLNKHFSRIILSWILHKYPGLTQCLLLKAASPKVIQLNPDTIYESSNGWNEASLKSQTMCSTLWTTHNWLRFCASIQYLPMKHPKCIVGLNLVFVCPRDKVGHPRLKAKLKTETHQKLRPKNNNASVKSAMHTR